MDEGTVQQSCVSLLPRNYTLVPPSPCCSTPSNSLPPPPPHKYTHSLSLSQTLHLGLNKVVTKLPDDSRLLPHLKRAVNELRGMWSNAQQM